jgi:hypothetical protein
VPVIATPLSAPITPCHATKNLEQQSEERKDAIERSVDADLLEARRAVYINFRHAAQRQRNYLRSLTGYADELARDRGFGSGEYGLGWLAHRELRLAQVNQAMGAAMTELSVYAGEDVLGSAREAKDALLRAEKLAFRQLESLGPPDQRPIDRIVEVNVTLQACVAARRAGSRVRVPPALQGLCMRLEPFTIGSADDVDHDASAASRRSEH